MARKIITMPTTPFFSSSRFTLNRAVGQTVSPFTGQQKTQEYDFVGWSADLTLPPQLRSTAVNWQSFLARLNGTTNAFFMSDPDAKTPTGTYDGGYFQTVNRVADTSTTLTFSASNKTITSNESIFGNAMVGDFIFVTGATNEENNGTKRVTATTSATVLTVEDTLVDESSTASCKVQQNVKGSTGLSLKAATNTSTGTIAVGDYLSIGSPSISSHKQYVLVTQVSDEVAVGGGQNTYAVRIEPKLRSDIAADTLVNFSTALGMFRLIDNPVEWSAGRNSLYNISFSVAEVI
tara:strand:- start:4473 stop:5348 length:876 start_codon:yes stop_codon:yes gene_type:complete